MSVTAHLTRRSLIAVIGRATAGAGLLSIVACAGQSAPAATSQPAAPAAANTPAASAAAATSPAAQANAAPSAARPYAGTKIKMMITTHPFTDALKARKTEFEKQTGISVQIDDMSFDVLNQRGDLNLSSGSSAYDVMQLIFIRSGRWIGAGWCTDLTPMIDDAKQTDQKTLDLPDFLSGSLASFQLDGGKKLFALPWLADSTMAAYREDVWKKAGYEAFPATYADFQAAAPKIEESTGGKIKAFVTQNNLHWIWPNWLMSYGGNFFKDPPTDLHPQFTTPAAHTAAQMFTDLLAKHSVAGGASLQPDVAELQIQQGNAATYLDGLGNVQTAIDPKKSKVRDNIRFAKAPQGPSGWFPQLAVHGLMIPAASQHKSAAWQFIQWASSKEMQVWAALNYGHVANTRASMLTNPAVVKKFSWHGDNIPQLHLDVMKQAGQGYMVFRTIPQFPPIGDRVTIALTSIASGQQTVDQALQALQSAATDLLKKQGVQLS